MKFIHLAASASFVLTSNAIVLLQHQQAEQVFSLCKDAFNDPAEEPATVKSWKKDLFYHDTSLLADDGPSDYVEGWAHVADALQSKWHRVGGHSSLKDDHPVPPRVPPDHPGHPPSPPPPHHPPGPPGHPPDHPHPPCPHHPHDPHHGHDATDGTIYENIGKSNYTKKLFKLINEFPDVVDLLNSTKSNLTFFAPIDSAFDKIPHHDDGDDKKKPSKDYLKKLLLYHTGLHAYTAKDVLLSHTLETQLDGIHLGQKGAKQRLRVGWSFRGPTLNFYSRIIAVNIFSKNGVVHGVDHILFPPPRVHDILEILPAQFSTFTNALYKTGVIDDIEDTSDGLTVFAPGNYAFRRLGPRILAFLFSEHGKKYLTALTKYHIVKGSVLYSDAYLGSKNINHGSDGGVPGGRYHVDLETLLGKNLAIDVARYGGFIEVKINGFSRVVVQDGIAEDGAIQVPNQVLIPPRGVSSVGLEHEDVEGRLTVEELKERLRPYL